MTVGYIPVSQRSSHPSTGGRRSNSFNSEDSDIDRDLESQGLQAQKPFRLSLGQRQLAGLIVFVWFVCLWIGLKLMVTWQALVVVARVPLWPNILA